MINDYDYRAKTEKNSKNLEKIFLPMDRGNILYVIFTKLACIFSLAKANRSLYNFGFHLKPHAWAVA